MEELFKPLYEAQKASESDKAHIGLVTKCWNRIKLEFQRLYNSNRFPDLLLVV